MIKSRSTKESVGEGSGGKSPMHMLTNSCQIRRSPRFTPVNGEIDNVCSVPVTGKFGSRKRKSCNAIDKVSRQIFVCYLLEVAIQYNVAYLEARVYNHRFDFVDFGCRSKA